MGEQMSSDVPHQAGRRYTVEELLEIGQAGGVFVNFQKFNADAVNCMSRRSRHVIFVPDNLPSWNSLFQEFTS